MEALFDQSAADYDAWYETELGRTVDQLQKDLVYSLLQPRHGQRLLEIGCGTGNYTVELVQRGLVVEAVDASKNMLEQTRKKLEGLSLQAKLIHGNIQELELSPGKFDAVLAVTSLEFFTEPTLVLAKAYDSLKLGGRLVVGIIATSPWSAFYKREAKKDPGSVYNHATFYTEEELLRLLPRGARKSLAGLYFPPNFSNFRRDEALAIEKDPPPDVLPGFISALWRKTND